MIRFRAALRTLIFVATAAAAFGVMPRAAATPNTAAITAVHHCGSGCGAPIARGSIVSGSIKIDISVTSSLALDRVRLEARPPGADAYICLQQWFGNQGVQMDESYTWDTTQWPKPSTDWGCPERTPHYHGEPARNGSYTIRVIAWDLRDKDDQAKVSDGFPLTLANVPAAPTWASSPTATTTDGSPVVLLRWKPNRETDIAEYHFRRTGPDGAVVEFAVDAASPDRQGCYKTSIFYGCPDTSFTGSPSGTYRYAILALRPTPGASTHCGLTVTPCSASVPGESREAAVTVPAASSSGSTTTSASPSATPAQPSVVPQAQSSFNAPVASSGSISTQATARRSTSPRSWPAWVFAAIAAIGLVAAGLWLRAHKERMSGLGS